jgi:1-phosphofructokinase family hexose kinase
MFLSVCPNTALDKILFIDEWVAGTPMRTDRIVNCVGGKGLNSAVVLSHLGVETKSIGFFAGSVGRELIDLVEGYGISVVPIWVGGTTRVAHVIADKKTKIHSHVIAGRMDVSAEQAQLFTDQFSSLIEQAESVIFAGSVPKSMDPGFYNHLIKLTKEKGLPTLVDAQNEVMREAIQAKPDIVKMNWEEFRWTFNKKSENLEDLVVEAESFHAEQDIQNLVITMSKEGILAVTEEGTYLAKAPLQKPLNAAGAGDAVSSALAVRLHAGDTWEKAMRFASAVSAAAVLTERTGDVLMEDAGRILPDVEIRKIN